MAAAFTADGRTCASVLTHKNRSIVGGAYGAGITIHTPLESWSMGKSLTATLMGVLIAQGVYAPWLPAPLPEGQTEGNPH